MGSNDLSERLHDMIEKVGKKLKAEKKASLTPEWLIENKDIFSCDVEGYKDFASPFYAIQIGGDNFATQDSSGVLRGGNVELDSCFVCMHLGKHVPLLQEKMYRGNVLEQIVARRITSIENTHRTLKTTTFSSCRITACKKISSLFGFTFSYTQVEDMYYVYDPNTGYLIGKTGTAFDAKTLKVKQSA